MSKMTFGFENEYFMKKDGQIVYLPDSSIPHDAMGWLAEVRSDPHDNPFKTLASFNEKHAELIEQVAKFGCTLECLAEVPFKDKAGFHIHFGSDSQVLKGLHEIREHHYGDWKHDDPPAEVKKMMKKLDAKCEKYYKDVKRHPHLWRPQPWGWEYRRLPATVDPVEVTAIVAELFWDGYKKMSEAA